MVIVERFPENMGNIVLGQGAGTSLAVAIGLFALLVITVVIINVWATGIPLKRPRFTQNMLDIVIMPLKRFLFKLYPNNIIIGLKYQHFFE